MFINSIIFFILLYIYFLNNIGNLSKEEPFRLVSRMQNLRATNSTRQNWLPVIQGHSPLMSKAV